MTKPKLQLAIYLSALLLAISVFLPLTSFPVYGEVSYYRIARVESYLVVALALVAPALILVGRERFSVFCLAGVWLVLLFPTLQDMLSAHNNNALQQLGDGVTSAMADFSADLFLNIAEFHWGGFAFLTALLVFTVASTLYQVKL
jgi:hypothetical protein